MYNKKKEELFEVFACPECKTSLNRTKPDELACPNGHTFPIVRNIPRFVGSDAYVGSFSFEWNTHNTTQLDSHRAEDKFSEDQFIQKTALRPEDVKGKLVLDAGIGAGRFSDVLVNWGAKVVGVDLSYAVEASHKNFEHCDNIVVAQADIGKLPFKPETFDYIISIGVLHHTPDTRKYFASLPPLVKKGGSVCIWVYPTDEDYVTRAQWIPYTSRIPNRMFYEWCRWFVPFAHRHRKSNLIRWFSRVFPYNDQGHGIENDILDTFDGYSPRYHGVHSPEEVEGWFREHGLVDIFRPSNWRTCVRGVRAQ